MLSLRVRTPWSFVSLWWRGHSSSRCSRHWVLTVHNKRSQCFPQSRSHTACQSENQQSIARMNLVLCFSSLSKSQHQFLCGTHALTHSSEIDIFRLVTIIYPNALCKLGNAHIMQQGRRYTCSELQMGESKKGNDLLSRHQLCSVLGPTQFTAAPFLCSCSGTLALPASGT